MGNHGVERHHGHLYRDCHQAGQAVREITSVDHARKMFKKLDLDDSGLITFDEIEDHLHDDSVQDFFQGIGVDSSEAKGVFEMLDMDGGGSIDFEEFLAGCLRLQGPARSIDLLLVMRE